MTISIKKTLQRERKEEQLAERKERQIELHTPPLKKVSRWQAEAILSGILDQAQAVMVAGDYVPNSKNDEAAEG